MRRCAVECQRDFLRLRGKIASASIRFCCSDRPHFGKPLNCVFVTPADGSFPSGRCLHGHVLSALVEARSVMGQRQIEVGHVDVRLVPIDKRDPICS